MLGQNFAPVMWISHFLYTGGFIVQGIGFIGGGWSLIILIYLKAIYIVPLKVI